MEGIYETKVPPEFRLIVELGCIISVDRAEVRKIINREVKDYDNFSMKQLNFVAMDCAPYLNKVF